MSGTVDENNRNGGEKQIHFEPSGRRIGDYQLGSLIGGGGMGAVYLAKQISMRRIVALKILRGDLAADELYMRRFFQEIRLLAKLEHPGIVQAIEAGVDRGTAFLAMEYVSGRDLKTSLNTRGVLTEKGALTAAGEVASVMKYAWNHFHLIHRDIKPANIMLGEDGHFHLLDLGISKQIVSASDRNELTSNNVMVGTPIYISPEQARGSGEIDFRADIYSLGITLFHLLAGVPPYDSPSGMEVVAMHFNAPIPDIRRQAPGVSLETSHLIRKMMAKKPEDRFSSWEELADEIKRILEKLPEDDVPNLPVQTKGKNFPRSEKRISSWKTLLFIFLILLLLAATLILLFMHSPGKTSEEPSEEGLEKSSVPVPAAPLKEQEKSADELRGNEIQTLRQESGKFEVRGDFRAALRIWEKYHAPEALKNDSALKERIAAEIQYIREKIRLQDSGL